MAAMSHRHSRCWNTQVKMLQWNVDISRGMIIFICSGSESYQEKPWNKLCAMLLTANLTINPTFQLKDSQSTGKINTAVGLQWRMCRQKTVLCTSVLWQDHTDTITPKAWTKSCFVGTYPLCSFLCHRGKSNTTNTQLPKNRTETKGTPTCNSYLFK